MSIHYQWKACKDHIRAVICQEGTSVSKKTPKSHKRIKVILNISKFITEVSIIAYIKTTKGYSTNGNNKVKDNSHFGSIPVWKHTNGVC